MHGWAHQRHAWNELSRRAERELGIDRSSRGVRPHDLMRHPHPGGPDCGGDARNSQRNRRRRLRSGRHGMNHRRDGSFAELVDEGLSRSRSELFRATAGGVIVTGTAQRSWLQATLSCQSQSGRLIMDAQASFQLAKIVLL